MVDHKTVYYVASLARLHIEPAEADRFAKNLADILQYVDQLNTLDVSAVPPTSHVLAVENVFRKDSLKDSLSQSDALAFSVEQHNGFYKVPKVIE